MHSVSDTIRMTFAASLALAAAGCAAMPAIGPKPQIREASSIEAQRSLPVSQAASWPADAWWKRFGDPQLDTLVDEALRNSPDVAVAAARFRKAAGMALEAGAARLPSLDGSATAYENRDSLNNGFPDVIRQLLPRGWRGGGRATLDAGFDIDLWGRDRAAYAAATSQMRAAAVDMQEARLMLSCALVYAYADLDQLYAQRDIRQAALGVRTATRDLVARRVEQGLDMRGSLRQSDAQVAQARAALDAANALVTEREHQIAALIGAGPDRGLTITRPTLTNLSLTGLPPGVTTDLVARRPDIVAAKDRVEAASKQVDVARADFFPAIRLDALIGFQAVGLSNLFQSDSTVGRVGPAVNLPIFHGGALRGRYRVSRADYDEAVARYDSTVLGAYREVADIMTRRAATASRLANARDALAASQDAYDIATQRYRGGLSNYLDTLAVEDRLLDARLAVSSLEGEARTLDVELIRALGGGFDTAGVTSAGSMSAGEKTDG